MQPSDLRLGIYADLRYHEIDGRYSTDTAFVHFLAAFDEVVARVVLFGRVTTSPPAPGANTVPPGIEVVPLPDYSSLLAAPQVLRALPKALRAFCRGLDQVDGVWIFGPHPFAAIFARAARRRGKSVFVGVRQDFPSYIQCRLPNRWWTPVMPVAWALEWQLRALARRRPTVVVGDQLARNYRSPHRSVLATGISLIQKSEIVSPSEIEVRERDWADSRRILSVGRLDAEKNPLLLLEILALLRQDDERWTLDVVGTGTLETAMRQTASGRGWHDEVTFHGQVAWGPELMRLYRHGMVFLHTALTEGIPQVLSEAAAFGLPVVATDVGGVRAALDGGALLIPVDDAEAAADALRQIATDADLRRRLVAEGLARAHEQSLHAQVRRIANYVTGR